MRESVQDAAVENTAMLHEEQYKRNRRALITMHAEERENYLIEWADRLVEALLPSLEVALPDFDGTGLDLEVREGFCSGPDEFMVMAIEVVVNLNTHLVQVNASGFSTLKEINIALIHRAEVHGYDEVQNVKFGVAGAPLEGAPAFEVFNLFVLERVLDGIVAVMEPKG